MKPKKTKKKTSDAIFLLKLKLSRGAAPESYQVRSESQKTFEPSYASR